MQCFRTCTILLAQGLALALFIFLALGQPWILSQIDGLLFPYTLESRLGDDGTEAPTALGLRLGGRGDPKKQEETSRLLCGYLLNHLNYYCHLVLLSFAYSFYSAHRMIL